MRTLQDNDSSLERKTALVCLELEKYKIDIAALSETRLAGISRLTEVKGGYDLFWSGKDETEPRHSGVGFAIRSDLARTLPSLPKGISDRIMTLTLELAHDTRAVLVSCYAPTLCSSDQEKDNFYNQLRNVISGVRHKDKIILLGDFNARVGSDFQSWEGVLGNHGVGRMNSNGLRLLSFCKEFDMCITNTSFQQKNCFKTTWMHPRSKDWHIIDYVITKRRDRKDFKLTRSFHTTCYLSDHALLRSKTQFRIDHRRMKRSSVPKRINTLPLKSTDQQEKLAKELDAAFETVEISSDIESSWKALREVTHSTSLEVLGLPIRKHQDWFDDNNQEVQSLIQKLHSSHKAWIEDKNSSDKKKAYTTCKSQVQKALRAMKEAWWSAQANFLQNAFDMKDSKAFYEGMKRVFGPQENGVSPISSANGDLLTDKDNILKRWKEHFDTVLNKSSCTDMSVLDSIPQRPEIPELSFVPTAQEVLTAIKQITSGKAPGKDAIPPEIFKYGGTKLVKKMLGLFTQIWQQGTVPQDFKDVLIHHLYKNKGNRKICDNHRGISLLSIAGKILARVILNRVIKHVIDDVYPESQCGFRAGRGTIDMIFSLRQIAEKVREKKHEMYMVFVDLTKAFDTVNRTALWRVLQKLGIPENMLRVIVSFHEGMKANVVSNGELSDSFGVTNGTKQGCVMAPVLFALYFSVMLKYAFAGTEDGIRIQFRTSGGLFNHRRFNARTLTRTCIIRDLLFADDAALVATSREGAQRLMDRFSAACKAFGLTISIRKTEVVHQPAPAPKQIPGVKQKQSTYVSPEIPITVDGHRLKYVRNFNYLGSKVNTNGTVDDEIVHRIAKASGTFGKLRHRLWKVRGITLKTKIKVYKATVLATLLYGSESWTLYRRHINQLNVFHKGCLRDICGITLSDRMTNADLFTKCDINSIESFLMRSQLRWVGHVIRMKDYRIPKMLLYSQLDSGHRNVGRPLLRYKDRLKYNLKATNIDHVSFEETAIDRDDWRSACYDGIMDNAASNIAKLRETRERNKISAAIPAIYSSNPHSCTVCGLLCKSLAGLKSHLRHTHRVK